MTKGLAEQNVFGDDWPEDIATVKEAIAYWDIRESVYLYDEILEKMPDLEAMVLAGERDHVQSASDKFNIRQALYGWIENGVSWVQLNPSPAYLVQADPRLAGRDDLPNMMPNKEPLDWNDVNLYTVPEDIEKVAYQLAGLWQMMDRVQKQD
ncbi:hypothetical protein HOM98_00055 [Candidatus Peregrinibacteria bacterium]|nr:hypothetical protein [Candidatus Peregrinibacteria bacterium]